MGAQKEWQGQGEGGLDPVSRANRNSGMVWNTDESLCHGLYAYGEREPVSLRNISTSSGLQISGQRARSCIGPSSLLRLFPNLSAHRIGRWNYVQNAVGQHGR